MDTFWSNKVTILHDRAEALAGIAKAALAADDERSDSYVAQAVNAWDDAVRQVTLEERKEVGDED